MDKDKINKMFSIGEVIIICMLCVMISMEVRANAESIKTNSLNILYSYGFRTAEELTRERSLCLNITQPIQRMECLGFREVQNGSKHN
jgi:hypothetical protein